MENQLVKFEDNAEYGVVAAAAKRFGLQYVGVKKAALIQMVNDHIDRVNTGDAEITVMEAEEVVVEATGTEGSGEATQTPAATPSARQPRAPRTPAAPRTQGAKWYETTAPLYNEGDVVDIIAGPSLIGRQAQITRPSAKKDAMKCKLINPKDGSLQGTEITMDYYKLKLAEAATPTVVDEQPVVDQEPTNEEQSA